MKKGSAIPNSRFSGRLVWSVTATMRQAAYPRRKNSTRSRAMLWLPLVALAVSISACSSGVRNRSSLAGPITMTANDASLTGTWVGEYSSDPVSNANVTLTFKSDGLTYTGTFKTSTGAFGTMSGKIIGAGFLGLAIQNTPACRGKYDMWGHWAQGRMVWQFDGTDCLGKETGIGDALRQD